MADMSYQKRLEGINSLDSAAVDQLRQDVLDAFSEAEAEDDLDAMSSAADALDQINAHEKTLATADATADAEVGVEQVGATAESVPAPADAAPVPVAASADPAARLRRARRELREALIASGKHGKKMPAFIEEKIEAKKDSEPDDDEDDAVTAASETPETAPVVASMEEDDDNGDDDDAVTAATTPKETEVAVEPINTVQTSERQPLVASAVTTIVAGADIPQRAAGSEFTSVTEVSEAFTSRLQTLRNVRGGDGEQVIVASIQSSVDSERELLPGQDQQNWAKVDSVLRAMKQMPMSAITASGGYCAPLETRYDIFGVGVADRPVRDSLAGFQATRGGIRYVQPPVLSSFSGSTGLWTAANDANPTSPTTKPFMTVACQPEVTATVDAITLEFQFGNLMTRAFPELVARNNELGLVYQARFAEQTLLNKISGLSTAVSSTFSLGTARDFLLAISKAATAYRHRHRMNVEETLRVMAPAWVLVAMREDLTRGFPGDKIEWADGVINQALAARNVNITWHLDDPTFTGNQNAGALNDFPGVIKWWIFAEGTFLFLDGGTLDLGIVRDSTLVNTNDYRMFVETFEGVAKVGIESIQVSTTTHVNGSIVGTTAPS